MLGEQRLEAVAQDKNVPAGACAVDAQQQRPSRGARLLTLAAMTALLVVCFARPLIDLIQFSLESELYSHILLVPFISGYLVWLRRHHVGATPRFDIRAALVPMLAALVMIGAFWGAKVSGIEPAQSDSLFVSVFALVLFFCSAFVALMGVSVARALAFPLCFLMLMAPFPQIVERAIEAFFQHTSAEAAYVLLTGSGLPVLRDGLTFHLAGVSMHVAPECSGLRSTFVLFITALVAGAIFLRSGWSRTTLALIVIPLGILRNAIRILLLAQLSIRVDPEVLNSALHTQGGPMFFAASLAPLLIALIFLRKWEKRKLPPT